MKRLLPLVISLAILAFLYWKMDVRGLAQVFRGCDPAFMALSLAMVVPLTLITARRLQQLMPLGAVLGFGEANRLILAASVLNMVLPSKMGDIAKAYFMRRGSLDGSLSLSLVVFEKTCDMLSLLLWCAFGLVLYPAKDWLFWILTAAVAGGLVMGLVLLGSRRFAETFFGLLRRVLPKGKSAKVESLQESWSRMQGYFWGDRARLGRIAVTSVFLWFLHLLQIWLFILALKAWTPFLMNMGLAPLAILGGLLPLTFAGIGTRDAAIVALYRPYFGPSTAAALGLLCTARYLLPALGGLPFLGQYLAGLRGLEKVGSPRRHGDAE